MPEKVELKDGGNIEIPSLKELEEVFGSDPPTKPSLWEQGTDPSPKIKKSLAGIAERIREDGRRLKILMIGEETLTHVVTRHIGKMTVVCDDPTIPEDYE